MSPRTRATPASAATESATQKSTQPRTQKPRRDLSAPKLAEHMAVDRSTILRWKRAGMPSTRRGNADFFNLEEARAFVAARGLTGKVGRPAAGDPPAGADPGAKTPEDESTRAKRERAELRKSIALATKHEMENAIRAGKYVLLEDVKKALVERAGDLRDKLLTIPAKLAPQLVGRDVREIEAKLQDEIAGPLEEYAAGELVASAGGAG